ncbi:hypothetical protein ACJ41O_015118 [Fusarium nematophilum]
MSIRSALGPVSKGGDVTAMKAWFVDHQISLCLSFVVPLLLAQYVPGAEPYTAGFLSLSGYNPRTEKYGLGYNDAYLVAFLVALLTGLRAGTMQFVWTPFARRCGLSKKNTVRFSEQAWVVLYYLICWPVGMYIYFYSPYWLNLREMWASFPDRELSGLMKAYMLAQLAFWLQQIIVINIEKRRKDHWQMFSHHIVTIVMVYSSYRVAFTPVGNVILVLTDLNDLIFSLAKCLKYFGLETLCNIMFGLFVVSWVLLRHVAFVMVCWSVYKHMGEVIPVGCFTGSGEDVSGPMPLPETGYGYLVEPLISNSGVVCYSHISNAFFTTGVLFLQALMILWLVMILKLVMRVVSGENAQDTRSDGEEEVETKREPKQRMKRAEVS